MEGQQKRPNDNRWEAARRQAVFFPLKTKTDLRGVTAPSQSKWRPADARGAWSRRQCLLGACTSSSVVSASLLSESWWRERGKYRSQQHVVLHTRWYPAHTAGWLTTSHALAINTSPLFKFKKKKNLVSASDYSFVFGICVQILWRNRFSDSNSLMFKM